MTVLTSTQIRDRGIIKDAEDNGWRDTTYDLTIGRIIDSDHKIHDRLRLKPRQMVWVVSKETIDVPGDVTGIALNKTTLTGDGLLALNFGVLDPNSRNPISTLIVNFGKRERTIKKGMQFLRLMFATHDPIAGAPKQIPYEEYIESKMEIVANNFDTTFLDMETLKREVLDSIRSAFPVVVSGFFALLFAFLALRPLFDGESMRPLEEKAQALLESDRRLEERVRALEMENARLKLRLAEPAASPPAGPTPTPAPQSPPAAPQAQ